MTGPKTGGRSVVLKLSLWFLPSPVCGGIYSELLGLTPVGPGEPDELFEDVATARYSQEGRIRSVSTNAIVEDTGNYTLLEPGTHSGTSASATES
jgi:hypothetical protein